MIKPFSQQTPIQRAAEHIAQVRRLAAIMPKRDPPNPEIPVNQQEQNFDADKARKERPNPHSVKNPNSLAATLLIMAHKELQKNNIEEYHRLCDEAARAEGHD